MNNKKSSESVSGELDKIELRSEKVRNIIGEVPSFILRWGNIVLVVILIVLLFLFFVFGTFYSFW